MDQTAESSRVGQSPTDNSSATPYIAQEAANGQQTTLVRVEKAADRRRTFVMTTHVA